MKLQAYAIFDKAVSAFNSPFFVRAKGEAIRGFTELCNDDKTQIGKYPADYTLFELGFYDDQNGIFECHDPVRVIGALECVSSDPVTPPDELFKRRLPM